MPTAHELARAITHARVEVRNPSLSPEHRQEFDHVLRLDALPDGVALLEALLTQTRINGVASVIEHVNMVMGEDTEGLRRVIAAGDPEREREKGGDTTTFVLCGADHFRYAFDDDFSYAPAELLSDFVERVIERGEEHELGGGVEALVEES